MSIARSKSHRIISAAAMVAIIDLTGASARADRTWVQFFNSTWNTASNWSPSGVPTSSDNVYITTNTGVQVTYNGTYSSDLSVLIDAINPNGGNPDFDTLHHNAGFDLNARYLYVGERVGGVGIYDQNGGNVSLRTGAFLGDEANSDGTYDISGGTLRVRGGGAGAGGQKGLYVGYGGTGLLTQTGGDISTGGVDVPLVLADNAGSTGTYNMAGTNSTAEFDGDAFIGGSPTAPGGEGELTITNGTASMSISGKLKIWNTGFSNVQLKFGSLSVGSVENVGIAPRFDWTGGTLTIGTNNSSSTFGATSNGGAGKLIKEGNGTLDISGVLSYTGGTTVNAGTLRTNSGNALGSGGVVIKSGATLSLNNTSLNSAISAGAGSTLTSNGTSSSLGTLSAPATGSIVLAHSGGGVLTIGNGANDVTAGSANTLINVTGGTADVVALPFSNNYVGAWSIGGGATLRVQNAGSLGGNSSAVDIDTGTLEIQNAALNRAITLNDGGRVKGTGAAASSLGIITLPAASSQVVRLATGTSTSDVLTIGDAANDLTGGGISSTITVEGAGTVVLAQRRTFLPIGM